MVFPSFYFFLHWSESFERASSSFSSTDLDLEANFLSGCEGIYRTSLDGTAGWLRCLPRKDTISHRPDKVRREHQITWPSLHLL